MSYIEEDLFHMASGGLRWTPPVKSTSLTLSQAETYEDCKPQGGKSGRDVTPI
jgi:hypothetical protein